MIKKKSRIPTNARQCLKCQKEFASTGYGNRICIDCNTNNVRISVRGSGRAAPPGRRWSPSQ